MEPGVEGARSLVSELEATLVDIWEELTMASDATMTCVDAL